jgi:ribosome-associated toxin RatA of RatAB toxin-antitoxin module
MREVKRTALVPYTPVQIFALVDDFERYPEFLPGVVAARLLERQASELVGSLTIERGGVRESFTTRNLLRPPEQMDMKLVDGPFRLLEGYWRFTSIKDEVGKECGTRIELNIRFEFKNPLTSLLFSKIFESTCASLVDAFAKRARDIYGKAEGSMNRTPTTGS